MSTGARLGILAGIVVVAVVALVIAGGGGDDSGDNTSTTTAATTTQATQTDTATSTTETTTTETEAEPAGPPVYTVTVENAKPVGGVKQIRVKKGDQVRLVVKSDTADEIHVHGYDLMKDVEAGGTARFNFTADIDGGFEIELENRGEQIAELTVEP